LQHIPTKLDHGFEFIGGDISTDFVNTTSFRYDTTQGHEHIQTYADLVEFARQGGLIKPALARRLLAEAERRPDKAAEVLRRTVALREAIWGAFSQIAKANEAARDDVQLISAEAADAFAHAQVMKNDDGFSWEWTDSDDFARPLWPIARAAADVLTNRADRALLRECADDVCAWMFIDRTRNHSRRWCDMETCGNRAKQRRFAKRQAS
jgi:predicted RNA-binding Zn ribbon-like protein